MGKKDDFLMKEIKDMAYRLQTHVDSGREYTFEWGGIQFTFLKNRMIVVDTPNHKDMGFVTAKGAAEFVLLNGVRDVMGVKS